MKPHENLEKNVGNALGGKSEVTNRGREKPGVVHEGTKGKSKRKPASVKKEFETQK